MVGHNCLNPSLVSAFPSLPVLFEEVFLIVFAAKHCCPACFEGYYLVAGQDVA